MDPVTMSLILGGLAVGGGVLSAAGSERSNRQQMKFNARQAALNRAGVLCGQSGRRCHCGASF